MPDPITYTNRKGQTYHLCQVTRANGKTRLVFSREPRGNPVTEMPAGYEPAETINGQVSLRRAGSSPIAEAEVQCVRGLLRRERRLASYEVEARKDTIVVHEPQGAIGPEMIGKLGIDPRTAAALKQTIRFSPVLRFRLVEPEKRTFSVERMCYRGSVDGWLSLHTTGPLAPLAARFLPHLGQETFFDLM